MDDEWLSGDDEDEATVFFMTTDILLRVKDLDEIFLGETNYYEKAKKMEKEIGRMVYCGRHEDVIFKTIVGMKLYPWKLEELEKEVCYLYCKKYGLCAFDSSSFRKGPEFVREIVKISPTLLKVKEAPQIILEVIFNFAC